MSIRYHLNRKDLFTASFQAMFQQRFLVVFVAIMSLWIGYQSWQETSPTKSLFVRVFTVTTIVLIPLLILSAFLALYLFLYAFARGNKVLLAEQAITVDDNILACQSEYARSEIKWKALQRTVRTRHYLFMYFSAMGAMVIPRRAFSSKEQWDSFVAFCKAKLGKFNQ